MASTVRLPRSFVGDKAAPLDDFFHSTAHALMRGDPSKQESVARICERKRDDLAGGGRRPLAQPFGRSTLALRRAPRRLLACAEHHTKVMVANFCTSGTSPARHAGRSDPLVLCKAGATLQCVATVESRAGHRELAFDCTPHPIIDGAFRQAVLHVHAGVLPDAVRAVLRLPPANPSSC